jgi:hypothetical protein
MSYADIELAHATNNGQRPPAYAAVIHKTVTAAGQDLYVTIPGIDPDVTWGPCRWEVHVGPAYPAKGDDALVMFDDDRTPWVVSWWTYA